MIRDTGHPFNLRAVEGIVSARFAGLPLKLPAHRSDLRIPAHSPEQQTTEVFPADEVIASGRFVFTTEVGQIDSITRKRWRISKRSSEAPAGMLVGSCGGGGSMNSASMPLYWLATQMLIRSQPRAGFGFAERIMIKVSDPSRSGLPHGQCAIVQLSFACAAPLGNPTSRERCCKECPIRNNLTME